MSASYAAKSLDVQSEDGFWMAFTWMYAPSGKKNGVARAGSSATIASQSACARASSAGLDTAGRSSVWGNVCGSMVVVVVGAVVVLDVLVLVVRSGRDASTEREDEAVSFEEPLARTTPTPAATTTIATSAISRATRRRCFRCRSRRSARSAIAERDQPPSSGIFSHHWHHHSAPTRIRSFGCQQYETSAVFSR